MYVCIYFAVYAGLSTCFSFSAKARPMDFHSSTHFVGKYHYRDQCKKKKKTAASALSFKSRKHSYRTARSSKSILAQ